MSTPPTPPAELNQKGRKIFGFYPRESASVAEVQSERTIQSRAITHSARVTLVEILLEMDYHMRIAREGNMMTEDSYLDMEIYALLKSDWDGKNNF